MTVEYLTGPALEMIGGLPDDSVDLVATSPPFLALRNYNDVEGQWGSEANPAGFLDNLLLLVGAIGPKLTGHGSIAFELGDTYSGSGDDGWPLPKSLTGVPTLFAWSLAYGRNLLNPDHTFEPWRIRNIIVWARPNPPVGALGDKFRPATSYITVATRSGSRWFDLDAVRSGHAEASIARAASSAPRKMTARAMAMPDSRGTDAKRPEGAPPTNNPAGAPPLDHCNDTEDLTWQINTAGSSLAHYAMWPPKLAERLILSMCPAEVCRECGTPRRRITGPAEYVKPDGTSHRMAGNDFPSGTLEHGNRKRVTGSDNGNMTRSAPTLGWSDCGHNNYRPGMTLDPFAGTGTTLIVADIHGRDAIGIDIDPINPTLYDARRDEVRKHLLGQTPEVVGQSSLWD